LGVIFAAGALLYLLARATSRLEDSSNDPAINPSNNLFPESPEGDAANGFDDSRAVNPRRGRDIAIVDYSFKSTDLRSAPPDRKCFYDVLTVLFQDINTGVKWDRSYTVCTPAGLEALMSRDRAESLIGESDIVVRAFDIDMI